jgi:hypothetical protein
MDVIAAVPIATTLGDSSSSSSFIHFTPGPAVNVESTPAIKHRFVSTNGSGGSLSLKTTSVLSICTLLVQHGASVSLTDAQGNTALHLAAARGLDTVGRLLINKGCPVNAQNTTDHDAAIHIAARHGHAAFLEMVIEFGAHCHMRNGQSQSAIDIVSLEGNRPDGYSSGSDTSRVTVLRRTMLTAEPRLRTLILFHEDCLQHTARRSTDWEGPDRLLAIMKRLRDTSQFAPYELEISSQFDKADVELLGRVHSAEYIAFVNALSKQV